MEQCLLDRNGKLHFYTGKNPNPISKHHEIAAFILPDSKNPLDELVHKGWIVIGSLFTSTYSTKEPSQSQINTLFDLKIDKVYNFETKNEFWKIF